MLKRNILGVLFIYIIYGEMERKSITQSVDTNKLVLTDVNVYCYVTCKFSKILALDSIRALGTFQIKQYFNMK